MEGEREGEEAEEEGTCSGGGASSGRERGKSWTQLWWCDAEEGARQRIGRGCGKRRRGIATVRDSACCLLAVCGGVGG